jgi:hypothetical protein
MKIIARDNFDRDNVDDILIVENVEESYAKKFVERLNEEVTEGSDYFYVMVDNDFKLKEFAP